MAQSYEQVRKQAAEYKRQVEELERKEGIEEANKLLNEIETFIKDHEPEEYRIAVSEFLDLVFLILNNYSYQNKRNKKAADMLNAYEKSMFPLSPYSLDGTNGKFLPEDLIVKKEEEIIEVIQSFPKKDIKDSKKDTKESYIGIDGLYFHTVDKQEEYVNDSLVTPDQINLVSLTVNFSMYNNHDPSFSNIIPQIHDWYALGNYNFDLDDYEFFPNKENSKNNLDYSLFYLHSNFEEGWLDSSGILDTILELSNNNSLSPNVFVDLYKINRGGLLNFFLGFAMDSDKSKELNKINLFLDMSILESLFNKNTKKIKEIFFIEQLIKKHNVEIHIYIVTAFSEYLKKEPAKRLKNFLIEIENNYNSKEQSKVSAAVENSFLSFNYISTFEDVYTDRFVTEDQLNLIYPYNYSTPTRYYWDNLFNKDKINSNNNLVYDNYYVGITNYETEGFADASTKLRLFRVGSGLLNPSDNNSFVNDFISVFPTELFYKFFNDNVDEAEVFSSTPNESLIIDFQTYNYLTQTTVINKINLFLDISNILNLCFSPTGISKFVNEFNKIEKTFELKIHIWFLEYKIEELDEKTKQEIDKRKAFLNNYFAPKETIQEKKKLIKTTKVKPIESKTLKVFPRAVAKSASRKAKRRKVKPRKKQIANNKVNTASKNNINNDVPVEYVDPMVSINETIGYNGQPLKYDEQSLTKERKYFGIDNNKEYLELRNEIDQFTREQKDKAPSYLLATQSADGKLSQSSDEYYLEEGSDKLDAHLFEFKEFPKERLKHLDKQKDKIYLMGYVNTQNYTKVNQLISALSNQELELRNSIETLNFAILDITNTNSQDLSLFNRKEDLKDYEIEKKSYENDLRNIKKQINELLKIRQTMKEYKNDDVEYKRTPSSRKIVTDEVLIDFAEGSEALGRVEEDNIIYLSYEDFIIQKEIKAIIDYNNKKRKK